MKPPADLTRLQSPHWDRLKDFSESDVKHGVFAPEMKNGIIIYIPTRFSPEKRKYIANIVRHIREGVK